MATREVPNGQTISRPTAEETAGYTISDWYIIDCGEHVSWKFDGYFAYTVHDNIDLYANFSYNTYSISFVDSVHQKQVEDLNVTYDSVYSLPSISEDGYTFVGWELNNEAFPNNGIYRIADSIILNAVWNANSYVVTLNPDGGNVSQNSLNVTFNSSYTLPTPTKTGYTFLGWYDGDTRVSSNATWKYSTNKTLKAKWSNTPMTFTFDAGDGECSVDSMVILYDESYELPTPYLFGFTFDGWYIDNNKIPQSGNWNYCTSGMTLVARYINNADGLDIYDGTIYSYTPVGDDIDLIIPSTVTTIDYHAFWYCSSLKTVTISNNVTLIKEGAFGNCESLSDIYYHGTLNNWLNIKNTNIYGSSLINVPKIHLFLNGSNEEPTEIVVPDGTISIGYQAFCGCSSLTSITIPDSVTTIESQAFSNCSSLSSIVIPNGVTSIGGYAFYNCASLTSITIPDSVTQIKSTVFGYCSSLTFINYLGTVEEWNSISKWDSWKSYSHISVIHCIDGDITL